MILFSTVLRLNKNFTQDDFIKTVIEWNQNSPHPENVISGIVWNGEQERTIWDGQAVACARGVPE